MTPRSILYVVLATIGSAVALAQGGQRTVGYERVLIPVAIGGEVPGVYGSLWKTELVGRNETDDLVRIWPDPRDCIIPCEDKQAPRSTFYLQIGGTGQGKLLWVKKPANERVFFNLRVFNSSRPELTWGTELPVVRENEAFTLPVQLLNIPTHGNFRQALRIYDIDPEKAPPAKEILVRIYPMDSNVPMVSHPLTIVDRPLGLQPDYAHPLQVEIWNLSLFFPQVRDYPRVRIELTPMSSGLRYWAFVSITNNETQQVTTITAH